MVDSTYEYIDRGGMFEPFDPTKHKEQDVGLGGMSTEYIATETSPDGDFWNIPTIWFDASGKAAKVDRYNAYALAQEYETRTGKRFPRFKTPGAGSFAAMNRSAQGGANLGALAQIRKNK